MIYRASIHFDCQQVEEPPPPKQPEPAPEVDEKEEERKRRDDEDKRRREDRERVVRERRYALTGGPAILVHPSSTAKSGKFDCTTMSLSVLLDYRPDDNKEHTFEVSRYVIMIGHGCRRVCTCTV